MVVIIYYICISVDFVEQAERAYISDKHKKYDQTLRAQENEDKIGKQET